MYKSFLISLVILFSTNVWASPPSCVEFEVKIENLNSAEVRFSYEELTAFVLPLLRSGEAVAFSNFDEGIKVRIESAGMRHFDWEESSLFVQINYEKDRGLEVIRELLKFQNLKPRARHRCL